ncbi:hypothetical protein O9992_16510 [Vibrio lentus]|nr:hypothetical protein [Vibrio lentus]
MIGPNLFVPVSPFLSQPGYQAYSGAWSALVFVMLGVLGSVELFDWLPIRRESTT